MRASEGVCFLRMSLQEPSLYHKTTRQSTELSVVFLLSTGFCVIGKVVLEIAATREGIKKNFLKTGKCLYRDDYLYSFSMPVLRSKQEN